VYSSRFLADTAGQARFRQTSEGSVTPCLHDVCMAYLFEDSLPTHTDPPLLIDCDECSLASTDACTDCMVTYLCSRQPGEAVVVELAEHRAITLLAGAGLVPPLRHVERG